MERCTRHTYNAIENGSFPTSHPPTPGLWKQQDTGKFCRDYVVEPDLSVSSLRFPIWVWPDSLSETADKKVSGIFFKEWWHWHLLSKPKVLRKMSWERDNIFSFSVGELILLELIFSLLPEDGSKLQPWQQALLPSKREDGNSEHPETNHHSRSCCCFCPAVTTEADERNGWQVITGKPQRAEPSPIRHLQHALWLLPVKC